MRELFGWLLVLATGNQMPPTSTKAVFNLDGSISYWEE